jgi:hypothetical protein
MSQRGPQWHLAVQGREFYSTLCEGFPRFLGALLAGAWLGLGGFLGGAQAAGPVRGVGTLPARELSAGYLNALRRASGTTAEKMAALNYEAVDMVLLAFVLLNSDGSLDFSYGNFDLYQADLVAEAHAHSRSVLMSVKGDFETVSASAALRQILANNIADALENFGFDGVDFDWEWPDTAAERDQFTAMLQAVYATVKARSQDYIVMFVQGPGYWLAGTDWAAVRDYSDFCFCIAYDWKNPANGPIRKPGSIQYLGLNGGTIEASAKGALDYIVGHGYPENKIIVGLPFYSSANSSWFNGAPTWSTDRVGYLAATDPNYLEVEFDGAWWTTPDGVKQKMNALLDPRLSLLAARRTVHGIGFWEFGHEDIAQPQLSGAIREWRAGDRSLGGLAPGPPTNTMVLIDTGSAWHYMDTGAALGPWWKSPLFTDHAWPSGLGPLGYGDGDEATVLNSSNGRITTYFRHSFQVDNPAPVRSLTLHLLRDDGAIVYLNGAEVFRSNMPTGAVTATTLAASLVTGAEKTTLFHAAALDPALLRAGTNLLAVEVHQGSTNSSDLSFEVKLLAQEDPASQILVPPRATWRYSDSGLDPGPTWTALAYDDTGWWSGRARLGYGQDGELTPLLFGTNAAAKPITCYFRHTFIVADPALFGPLRLHLQRDDGAVIHLNGRELFRSNIPEGVINISTPAASTVSGANETNWITSTFANPGLVSGANILAVEIHQASPTSSDLGLELQLAATLQPRLTLIRQGADLALRWPAGAPGFRVEFTEELGPSATWLPELGTPVLRGFFYELMVSPAGDQRFYRLVYH